MPGIYVHIPFCKTRCDYCAFYSTTHSPEVRERYVQRLCREVGERKAFFGSPEVSSIYLGGGTPSQLSIENINDIFGAIYKHFHVLPDAEITMEVNPDDITEEYAAKLGALPVNRVSMGVQSLDNKFLSLIHRRHSAAKAVESYELLRKCGFKNISLDLIYALPGQTLAEWGSDVDKMLALRPEHISAYALSYEEGTALYGRLRKGEIAETSEDLYTAMYAMLVEKLHAAGYEHYEISNFALPGKRARHNSSYWTGEKYLGLGAGAHSFDGVSRRMNMPDVMNYIGADEVACETECLTSANKYDEMIMTRLRTCEGVNLEEVEKRFGVEMRRYLMSAAKVYVDSGKMELVETAGGMFLKLTGNGIFVSDGIIAELMNPD